MTTKDYCSDLIATAKSLTVPKPPFSIKLALADDYDSLFSEKFSKKVGIDELEAASPRGRILITGRGGSAKTVLVKRLAIKAAARGDIPVLVGLRAWSAADYNAWSEAMSPTTKIDYLLANFTKVPTTSLELDSIAPNRRRILLIDGLNEVSSRIGQDIIFAADEFVRFNVNASVVLTDRLVRRSFDSSGRWQLAQVMPLSLKEVQAKVGIKTFKVLQPKVQRLLTLPFFLSGFLRDGQLLTTANPSNRSAEFHSIFIEQGLNESDLQKAADAAYKVYELKTRTFPLTTFRATAGPKVVTKLLKAKSLVKDPRRHKLAFFDHHLKHDYLASKFVASNEALWTPETFKVITFMASSFDSLAMTMEQVADNGLADSLLRKIYDWNFYGAGYALAESGESAVSREMRVVILSMFSERRWDLMKSTAKRAEDTLSLIKSDDATALRKVRSYSAIYRHLRTVKSERVWFNEWKKSFIRPKNGTATDADFQRLENEDSVAGWTTSNVMKRLRLSSAHQAKVRNLLHSSKSVIRWRAAHVLGAFPSDLNVSALVARMVDDDSDNVKFGSLRSLIEIAIRSETHARRVFTRLQTNVEVISASTMLVEEFQRSLLVRDDKIPKGWRDIVLPLVTQLESEARSPGELSQWHRLLKYLAFPSSQ
jgi:hypothetical protein